MEEVKASVLIVEDDPDLGLLIRIMLAKHGYQCTVATSLSEGRRLAGGTAYTFLLVDLVLPDGNGLDLLPLLASSPNRDTPVVVASGNITAAIRRNPGVRAAFQKPYDMRDLLRFMAANHDDHRSK